MSQVEKLKIRLKSCPKYFTYEELRFLLIHLGFVEFNKGKTSGSRVQFVTNDGKKLELHKPHPNNIIKEYKLKYIINMLKEWRMI